MSDKEYYIKCTADQMYLIRLVANCYGLGDLTDYYGGSMSIQDTDNLRNYLGEFLITTLENGVDDPNDLFFDGASLLQDLLVAARNGMAVNAVEID